MFEKDNDIDLKLVSDMHTTLDAIGMHIRVRAELILEVEKQGYSPEVYESLKLLKDLQETDNAKARAFMRVINETEIKILEKISLIVKFQKLNENRRELFRNTCFGKWLDISLFDHETHFIDYILQKQVFVDDVHYDMPLIYNVEGDVKFVSRVLPHKLGLKVTNLDLLGVIEDEELFGKLVDDDAMRVCLLLALEVIFMGKKLVDEVPDTLMHLVENLEVWNDFRWGEYIWRHLYNQILNLVNKNKWEHLQGLSKSRNYVAIYTLSGFVWFFKSASRKRGKLDTRDLPIIRRCDTTSVEEIRDKDCVISQLNSREYKLETIIKDLFLVVNAKEYFCLEYLDALNEEFHELYQTSFIDNRPTENGLDYDDDLDYLIQEEFRVKQEEEERCRLEELKMQEALFLSSLKEECIGYFNEGGFSGKVSSITVEMELYGECLVV
ncbi:hypothetical protein Tco_0308271 [Tanacetum coccineum]